MTITLPQTWIFIELYISAYNNSISGNIKELIYFWVFWLTNKGNFLAFLIQHFLKSLGIDVSFANKQFEIREFSTCLLLSSFQCNLAIKNCLISFEVSLLTELKLLVKKRFIDFPLYWKYSVISHLHRNHQLLWSFQRFEMQS